MGGSGAAEEKIEGGKRCSLPKLFQQEGLVAEICVCECSCMCGYTRCECICMCECVCACIFENLGLCIDEYIVYIHISVYRV